MTPADRGLAGFVVLSAADPSRVRDLADEVAAACRAATSRTLGPSALLVRWGAGAAEPLADDLLVTVRGAWARDRDVTAVDAARILGAEHDLIARVTPPFGAVGLAAGGREVVACADWLGFQHLYVTAGRDWSAVSSSAGVLGGLRGAGLDREAVAVQALLGWQLGARTLHAGVRKVAPGERVTLEAGRLRTTAAPPSDESVPGAEAPPEVTAAELLRATMATFLDAHPDALLQLTGGLDSRILLAAIPRERRSEVEAMTLVVPGSPDAEIAARLTRELGMRHHLVRLDELDALSPATAWGQVRAAADRVHGTADPLGLAVLLWAERHLPPRPRIAGLGGEVARGFYHVGPPVALPVTRVLAAALARWRLTPNERVSLDALVPEFARAAEALVAHDTHAALVSTGRPWWDATDELYLWERMHRWAGVLASATSPERMTVNPMLDRRFVDLVRQVPASTKHNMGLLSRILLELDPGLAGIAMDHRPPPEVYATSSPRATAALTVAQARRVTGKVQQRLRGVTRPPAGAEVLAERVVEHWRRHPDLLDPARGLGVLRETWLDDVAAGRVRPAATTVSFLVDVLVAADHQAQAGTSRLSGPSTAGRAEGRSSARTEARDS